MIAGLVIGVAGAIGLSRFVAGFLWGVTTTDPTARTRFRWYWARFSPGIILIRRVMLGLLKTDAERRAVKPS